MTVSKRKHWRTWRYDFVFRKKRYEGNTYQLTKADAQLMERELQLKLRHEAGNIGQFFASETPRFSDWAEIFLEEKRAQLVRPDHVEWVTGVVLRFFGSPPPGVARTAATPYHDVRLGDVIADPEWIVKFEAWMRRRTRCGPQSRNHYRSMLRRMYALALQPKYRKTTGITSNPFVGIENDQTMERTVILDPAQVQALLKHASYHVRVAVAIAALAPKLRLDNILKLEWTQIRPDPRPRFEVGVPYYVTIHRHKTARTTRRPLVTAIPDQLVRILEDAYRRAPESRFVVTYRGDPLTSIRDGVRLACREAGLRYGRDVAEGVTFHTLRHTAATLISLEEPDPLRLRDALGHTDLATTLRYRHMRPAQELPALERLSKVLDLEGLVLEKRKRAERR